MTSESKISNIIQYVPIFCCFCVQFYKQYDDTEIGALDHEEISGCIQDGDLLMQDALAQWEEARTDV